MSQDRIVRWVDGEKPTPEQVKFVLEDFFNGQATITWDKNRYMVCLPGSCKHPLLRISPLFTEGHAPEHRLRWLEVWEDKERTCLDVMTRLQDEYVNALAEGLIEVFRRFWQAQPLGNNHNE